MRCISVSDDRDHLTILQRIQRSPRVRAIPGAVFAALTVLGALHWPASAVATPAAAGTPAAAEQKAVIQPGQEALVGDMLGKGATLPDGCALTGGNIAAEAVAGTYRCAAGEVSIELQHPSVAPPEAQRTQQFALTVTGGKPPPALIDALTARIRDHEGKFEWTWMAKGPPPTPLPRLGAAALVLVVLGAAAWWMARRSKQSGVSPPG